jgi:hypothetical protein
MLHGETECLRIHAPQRPSVGPGRHSATAWERTTERPADEDQSRQAPESADNQGGGAHESVKFQHVRALTTAEHKGPPIAGAAEGWIDGTPERLITRAGRESESPSLEHVECAGATERRSN